MATNFLLKMLVKELKSMNDDSLRSFFSSILSDKFEGNDLELETSCYVEFVRTKSDKELLKIIKDLY